VVLQSLGEESGSQKQGTASDWLTLLVIGPCPREAVGVGTPIASCLPQRSAQRPSLSIMQSTSRTVGSTPPVKIYNAVYSSVQV